MRIPEIQPDYFGMKNFARLDLPYVSIYYSYKTMIAFQYKGDELRVSSNYWGTTTGKHINLLQPDKKLRLENTTFLVEFNKGPTDGIDNLAIAALEGNGSARDAILDAIK